MLRLCAAPPTEIALAAYGRAVGTLRFREPVVPLRTVDRQLLIDLAGHLGGVIRTRQFVGDLQHSLERTVLAREEERRRLRRDLHDGLGPALAGDLLRLDVIAARLDQGLPASREVGALRDDLRETVLEVRRLVEGLRPPALDELGLTSALQQVLSPHRSLQIRRRVPCAFSWSNSARVITSLSSRPLAVVVWSAALSWRRQRRRT